MLFELITTNRCSGKCFDCLQGCGLFPTTEQDLTDENLYHFIDDIKNLSNNVDTITIIGGEFFFHPSWKNILFQIVKELRKLTYRPIAVLYSLTNNFSKEVAYIKSTYKVLETSKTKLMWKSDTNQDFSLYEIALVASSNSCVEVSDDGYRHVEKFIKINNSIIDFNLDFPENFSEKCAIKNLCGFSYNKQGWYQCVAANTIDRIFKFDLAAKSLSHSMKKQNILCKYCGYMVESLFKSNNMKFSSDISNQWKRLLFKDLN